MMKNVGVPDALVQQMRLKEGIVQSVHCGGIGRRVVPVDSVKGAAADVLGIRRAVEHDDAQMCGGERHPRGVCTRSRQNGSLQRL